MEVKTADPGLPLEHDTVQRLREEVAAVRAELQALRSTTQPEASSSTVRTSHGQATFRSLDLPRELRNLVYESCVVVGEVRILRPGRVQQVDMRYDIPRYPRAEVSLFVINKQVRRESGAVSIERSLRNTRRRNGAFSDR
jgi:hypothetical protein